MTYMTGLSLAVRAERALVGALLAEPDRFAEVSHVRAGDFADPSLGAVFTAIAVDAGGGQPPTQMLGFDAENLRGLAQACPEPGDAAVYARMVTEAGLRRELAGHSDRLSRLSAMSPGADGEHLGLLSQAVKRQGQVAERLDEPSRTAGPATSAKLDREDLILADLLQHREMIGYVHDLLRPEFFTAGDRRDVYQAMISVAGRGEPLGELTVAWEMNRIGPAPDTISSDRLSDYLGTLATTTVERGAALLLGQELMADVFRVELEAMAADLSAREAAHEAMRPRVQPQHGSTHTVQPDSSGLLEPPRSPDLGPDGPSMRM